MRTTSAASKGRKATGCQLAASAATQSLKSPGFFGCAKPIVKPSNCDTPIMNVGVLQRGCARSRLITPCWDIVLAQLPWKTQPFQGRNHNSNNFSPRWQPRRIIFYEQFCWNSYKLSYLASRNANRSASKRTLATQAQIAGIMPCCLIKSHAT